MSLNNKIKPSGLYKKLVVGFMGIKMAFRTEPTLLIQVLVGLITILIVLFIGGGWWFVKQTFFLTLGVVLAELINTAIEYLCDLLEMKKNSKVKKIKDLSAGFVLIVALAAMFITALDFINFII
jgi:diacylglycerol kinase